MMTRAIVLLLASTALGSCGVRQPAVPVAPVIVFVTECPAPARPALPHLNGSLPFDHPVNVEAILERDDAYRAYIQGLEAAIECYRVQTEGAQ